MWRVWIEITFELIGISEVGESPSVWRVWIEITTCGVDASASKGHPPCGGCGLKWLGITRERWEQMSPSVWRVWIEIFYRPNHLPVLLSPSVWRVWIEIML